MYTKGIGDRKLWCLNKKFLKVNACKMIREQRLLMPHHGPEELYIAHQIMKYLRVIGDCHSAFKQVSSFSRR